MSFFSRVEPKKKKIDIPTGETREAEAVRLWSVRWMRRTGKWHNDLEQACEMFFNEQDAKDYKEALLDALNLLRNASKIERNIELRKEE